MKYMFKFLNIGKAFTLMISMVLIASAGRSCGNPNNGTTPTPTKAPASTAAPAAAKPITLTLGGVNVPSVPAGPQNDAVMTHIADVTGVTIDFIDCSAQDKFTVLLATNDLPDLMLSSWGTLDQMIEGKQVIVLNDLLQARGQNILNNAPDMIMAQTIEFSESMKRPEDVGKIYFIATMMDDQGWVEAMFTPWVRWDYYKELGYPEVKTFDQLIDVCAKMIKNHPTNEDGKQVYAFPTWMEYGVGFGLASPGGTLEHAWGGAGLYEWDLVNEDLRCAINFDDSSWWKTCRMFNKINRMGIMDPETLTHSADVAMGKIADNRYVACFYSWTMAQNNPEFFANGHPESGYMPLAPVPGNGAYWGQIWNYGAGDRQFCIASTCKEPERAMDLLDYLWSYDGCRLIFNGVEGVHYDSANGYLDWKPEIKEMERNDPTAFERLGIGDKYASLIGLGGNALAPDGQAVNLRIDEKVLAHLNIQPWALLDDYAAHYGVDRFESSANFRQVAVKYSGGAPYMYSSYLTPDMLPTPDDINRIGEAITEYCTNELPKLIVNAKSDEEFEAGKQAILDELFGMGLQQYMDFNDANNAHGLEEGRKKMGK
jgi:hypothetical protein